LGKVIAIDYGGKHIGLAIGELVTMVAMPWRVIEGKNDSRADADTVYRELKSSGEQIDKIVVGLPLNMDGSEGPQAGLTRRFGQCLAEISQVAVEFWDERLSSFEAQQRYGTQQKPGDARGKRGRRAKKRLDAVAAAVILEEYLRSRGND